jgi:Tfp pilus assembly protein PilN
VRPVNLLPENLRPRERREGSGAAYLVLGVLGALLVGVLLYVVTANQITSRQAETERLRAETSAAEQRAGALARFGTFKDMKEIRMISVAALAAGRLDWERMTRELAYLLPKEVWLTDLKATATGEDPPGGSGGSSGSSSSSSGATSAAAAGAEQEKGPSLVLNGCSPTQEAVAETLVRLRRLHQAGKVELIVSEQEDQEGAGTATPAPAGPAGASGGGAPEGCGATRGRLNYKFEVKVELAPSVEPPVDGGSVPEKLGGGA